VIEFKWPRYFDQVPDTETWSLDAMLTGASKWHRFRGPRFSVSLMVCDGLLEEVCAEIQVLRDSCPVKPRTIGFTCGWTPRQLPDQDPVIVRRVDGTVRFSMLWVVTTGRCVMGEFYSDTRPDEPQLCSFGQAVKEWVEENPHELSRCTAGRPRRL
jgi:hypothetical protein